MPVRHDPLEIRLAQLVAAASAAAPKLNPGFAHRIHQPDRQRSIRFDQHQIEGIVARAFKLEISAVSGGVDSGEETQQIAGSPLHIRVQSLELAPAHNAANLGVAHVVGGVGKDEIRVQLRIVPLIRAAQFWVG